ncbi:MAG: CapA family protein [Leucobacter sp.]
MRGNQKQTLHRLAAVAAATVLLGGVASCATEAAPEPQPVVTAEPTPTPTPTPTPEPQPGNGPECPTDHCVTVAMSGDMLIHENLWRPYAIPTNDAGENFDFAPLLEGQKRYLDQTDLAICQMETPLAPVGGPYLAYPAFSTPPEIAQDIKDVGYDVCTTASNHTVDQGTAGLIRTLDGLEAAGLEHTGSYREEGARDEPLIVEANGVKIGIITSTFSLNGLYAEHDWQVDYPLEPERAAEKAQKARDAGAEIVLGAQHAGTEYATMPDQQQLSNAHQLVDTELFDFVYNHHSHSVQPLEVYNDTWVAYGTGNAVSVSHYNNRLNDEFLMVRIQFAQQEDESWTTNAVSYMTATNKQNGAYKWCSVASDAPQGVCQSPEFDADVRDRTRATVEAMGAAEHGITEWLVTEEE